MAAVKSVFPDANVEVNCSDSYPIMVSVVAKMGATKVKVWEGSQKKLFRKYAADRTKSIQAITIGLQELAEDFSLSMSSS